MIPLKLLDNKGTTFGVERILDRQRVSAMPYEFDIVEGNIPNHGFVSKFGHDSATTNAIEEVWDGSRPYPYITTASALFLSSSDTNDDQPYEIEGLDEAWRSRVVEVTANGFVSVELPGLWMRVFRVRNMGITDNAGTIYVSLDADAGGDGIPDTLATDSKAEITPGFNQTLMAMWSCPENTTAFLTNFYASCSDTTAKTSEIGLWVREFESVFQIKKIISINSGRSAQIKYDFPLKIPSKSDIRITSNSNASMEVSAGFDLWHEEL